MKKFMTGFLAVMLIIFMAGCGKGSKEAESIKEHVYKAEEVSLDEIADKSTLRTMFMHGEKMYLVGYNWEEDAGSMYIVKRNPDGTDSTTVTIPQTNQQSFDFVTVDDAGNYYMILTEYYEDDSDPENYIWENYFYLVKTDASGKELWRQELKSDDASREYFGVYYMDLMKNGQIMLLDDNGLSFFDAEGKFVKKQKTEESLSGSSLIKLKDGSVVVNLYNETTQKYSLRKLDLETGKLSEEYIVPGQSGSYSYYPGVGWDFLLTGNAGVYGYNLGDEDVTELMNVIDSDLTSSYIYNIQAVDELSFYGMMDDSVSNETVLMKFTKVNPEDVVDKTVLTLGCNGLDYDVRKQVVDFNKGNSGYRIQIRDYSEYNTDEDYEAGITKLNTDIASGNVPDIILLQMNMPVDSFMSKGLLEDLYPYIDADEELNRENYFSNVLEANEKNGKLYRLTPSFIIQTVAGKTADVGKEPGWTLDDLNTVMAGKPEGTQIFSEMTRSDIMNICLSLSGSQFVDWETGECKFNSDSFIQYLEFMKQFPEQIDQSGYDEAYWNEYETMWRNGKILLNQIYLDSFSSYNYMKKGTFGEDITMIGFPSENKKGAAIVSNLDLAMSSKSKNKDGVWQFMRYFLTEEYQSNITYGWPLNKKCMTKLEEKAQVRDSYVDENGNTVEYDPEYTMGDITVAIKPMTQAEVDEVVQYISSVDQVYTYDENLINIITEEAAPYFSGQKNAKEVADIIESRAQIYVNENR